MANSQPLLQAGRRRLPQNWPPRPRPTHPSASVPRVANPQPSATPGPVWQVEPALTLLARRLAEGPTPAGNVGVIAFGQGAAVLTMLLGVVEAADDGGPAAKRRKAMLWPSVRADPNPHPGLTLAPAARLRSGRRRSAP